MDEGGTLDHRGRQRIAKRQRIAPPSGTIFAGK